MARDAVGCEIRKGDRVLSANGGVYYVNGGVHYVGEVHPTDNKFAIVGCGALQTYYGNEFYVLARGNEGSKSENIGKIAEAILKLNNAKPRNPTKEEIVACINEAVK